MLHLCSCPPSVDCWAGQRKICSESPLPTLSASLGQAGGSLLQFIISCKNLVEVKIRNLITTGQLPLPPCTTQSYHKEDDNTIGFI